MIQIWQTHELRKSIYTTLPALRRASEALVSAAVSDRNMLVDENWQTAMVNVTCLIKRLDRDATVKFEVSKTETTNNRRNKWTLK